MASTLAEIARAEEVGDEPETVDPLVQPDDPEEGEAEEQDEREHEAPTPEQPEAPTPEQIEARGKAWERERDRHFRELKKRDEYRYAQSEVCILCEGHGMFWPVLGEPGDTLRREAVVTALGGNAPVELLDDPDTERCERCNGKGMLKTNSDVPNQTERVCTACNGQGWRLKTQAGTVAQIFAQPAPANGTANVTPSSQGAPDAWGRPQGHPHYGLLPSQVGA